MTHSKSLYHTVSVVALTAMASFGVAQQAGADLPPPGADVGASGIYNKATVTASYGSTSVQADDEETVGVIAAAPNFSITKTAALDISNGLADRADAGDTITYTFVIKNEGNVTMTGVTPKDAGPTFNGQPLKGTLSGFTVDGTSDATTTLAPNAEATFKATYTLADLDVYHAADTDALTGDAKKLVSNTAAAIGVDPKSNAYEDADTSTALVELTPKAEIKLVKLATLAAGGEDDDLAEVGETITYTYTVTNTGNVPLTNVSVADVHEGSSLTSGTDIKSEALSTEGPLATTTGATSTDDATADNGVWAVLQPEAVVTFTYVHTVTQTEVDDG